MTTKEIQKLLNNLLNTNFMPRRNEYGSYKSLKPETIVYYHVDLNNFVYFNVHVHNTDQFDEIKQMLNKSKFGYISSEAKTSIQFYLYDNLKNIDI